MDEWMDKWMEGEWMDDITERVTYEHRSCCHGNVHLNDDSKSQRNIPIASCVILNSVDVCGRQSAHDNKSYTHMLQAESA